MAYNEDLAHRIRVVLALQEDLEEKKMMGGLTFMVNGKMCVGVVKDDLMVGLNPEIHEHAIEQNGCREMDFTGKPMKGYVFVSLEVIETDRELRFWVDLALAYNSIAKAANKKKKRV